MATQWGKEATPVSDEQKEEFAFRGGLKQRYRQQMEDIIAGKPYDAAAKLMQDESRRAGAEALAVSGTRNIGALTDVSERMARQAAGQMANLELDKSQARTSGLEALQQADTVQSEKDKKKREYEVAIRDYARKSGKLGMGMWGEQEDTAAWVDALAASEADPELKRFLEQKAFAIRGGGQFEGETIEKWDV